MDSQPSHTTNDSSSEDTPDQGSVTLVGTVHVSEESFNDVQNAINTHDPDVVALELDDIRFRKLRTLATTDSTDTTSPSLRDRLFDDTPLRHHLIHTAFKTIQERVATDLGVDPSMSDMRVALDAARDTNTPIATVDRSFETTVNRFYDEVRPIELARLTGSVAITVLAFPFLNLSDRLSGDPAELLPENLDVLESKAPSFVDVFIHERDAYIAHHLNLLRATGRDVVAVVGAGHEPGVQRYLDHPDELANALQTYPGALPATVNIYEPSVNSSP